MAKGRVITINRKDLEGYHLPKGAKVLQNPGVTAIMGVANGRGAYARAHKMRPNLKIGSKTKVGGLKLHRTPPKRHRERGATQARHYAGPGYRYPVRTERRPGETVAQWHARDARFVKRALSYYGKSKKMYSPAVRRQIKCGIARAARQVGLESPRAMQYRKQCGVRGSALKQNPGGDMGIFFRTAGSRPARYRTVRANAPRLFANKKRKSAKARKSSQFSPAEAALLHEAVQAAGLPTKKASVKTSAQIRKEAAAAKRMIDRKINAMAKQVKADAKKQAKKVAKTEASKAARAAVSGGKPVAKKSKKRTRKAAPKRKYARSGKWTPSRKARWYKARWPKGAKPKKARVPTAKLSARSKGYRRWGQGAYALKRRKQGKKVPTKYLTLLRKYDEYQALSPSAKARLKAGKKKTSKKRKAKVVRLPASKPVRKAAKRPRRTAKGKRKAIKVKANYRRVYRTRRMRRNQAATGVKPISIKKPADFAMTIGYGVGGYAVHRIASTVASKFLQSFLTTNMANVGGALLVAGAGYMAANKLLKKDASAAILGMGLSTFGMLVRDLFPAFANYTGFGAVPSASTMPRYSLGQYYQAAAGRDPFLQAAAGRDPFLQAAAGEYFAQPALGEYYSQDMIPTGTEPGQYLMQKLDVQGDTGSYEFHQAFSGSDAAVDNGVMPNADMDAQFNFMEAAAGLGAANQGAAPRSNYIPHERALPAGARSTNYEEGIFDNGGIFQG